MDSNKTIDTILQPYKPEVHFIKSYELIDDNKMKGIFLIKSNFYSASTLNHVSVVELEICLNQLLYAYAYEKGHLGGTQKNGFPVDLIIMQNEKTFIVKQTVKCREIINASKEIICEIEYIKGVKRNNSTFHFYKYNFENYKIFGQVTSAIIK